jgi:hypothetical protein
MGGVLARRALASAFVALSGLLVPALALAKRRDAAATTPETRVPDTALERGWTFAASGYAYVLPDMPSFVQPTLAIDHASAHMELRYNYEALETGSAWLGVNTQLGEEVTLDLTQMIGVAFGGAPSVVVGYEATIAWWQLELYSEGELAWDPSGALESYFYTWTELRLRLFDVLCVGGVVQRTRAFESQRDLQRGLLIGLDFEPVAATVYVFNPDRAPTLVLGLDVRF